MVITIVKVVDPGDAELGIPKVERRLEIVDRDEAFHVYQAAIKAGFSATAEQVRRDVSAS